MAFIERRTFVGKVGQGGPLIEHTKQLRQLLQGAGQEVRFKVLSDFMSGRTDRVVYEVEVDDWAAYLRFEQSLGDSPLAKQFEEWFARLSDLIQYAEVELWQTH